MLLLNFTHPLTDDHLRQVEALTGQRVERAIEVPAQFDHDRPFAAQVAALADAAGLDTRAWQSEPLLIVPPALNFIAAALLAELHGRAGYFVPVVRTRPVVGALPPRYEVAEILDLQGIRDRARRRR